MPIKVLLVEDDSKMSDIVRRLLEREQMSCDCVSTGEEAAQIGKVYNYDIVILDIGLPDTSGHDLLNRLRKSHVNAPVLVLSGIHSIKDKIKALGFGADDYLTKPFIGDELIARVKALSRRAAGHSSTNIRVGNIELNMETKNIFANGRLLDLTGKEYDILEFLLLRNGSTVTKAHFLNRLYPNTMDEPEAKIIDVFIHKLRRKLEMVLGRSGRDYISTVWGRGYSLKEPTTQSNVPSSENVISMPT
jgi:two-component system cell cycle response regulator CtrA